MSHIHKSEVGEIKPCIGKESIIKEDESFGKDTTGYIVSNEEQLVKLLGVSWNASNDNLTYNIQELVSYVESLTFMKCSLLINCFIY